MKLAMASPNTALSPTKAPTGADIPRTSAPSVVAATVATTPRIVFEGPSKRPPVKWQKAPVERRSNARARPSLCDQRRGIGDGKERPCRVLQAMIWISPPECNPGHLEQGPPPGCIRRAGPTAIGGSVDERWYLLVRLIFRNAGPAAVATDFDRSVRQLPEARLTGFTVQRMVRRPLAQKLIVGASIDRLFGPVLLFGQGGTAVEVIPGRQASRSCWHGPGREGRAYTYNLGLC